MLPPSLAVCFDVCGKRVLATFWQCRLLLSNISSGYMNQAAVMLPDQTFQSLVYLALNRQGHLQKSDDAKGIAPCIDILHIHYILKRL